MYYKIKDAERNQNPIVNLIVVFNSDVYAYYDTKVTVIPLVHCSIDFDSIALVA